MREQIANILKKDYPKTWEEFRNYLRTHYEFWQLETNKDTLWFCERSFQTQLGYFMEYFAINKVGDVSISKVNDIPKDTYFMDFLYQSIIYTFEYLENQKQ